ncbi:MAG: hypothetical protein NVS9B10_01940 [Nevskia sp.]
MAQTEAPVRKLGFDAMKGPAVQVAPAVALAKSTVRLSLAVAGNDTANSPPPAISNAARERKLRTEKIGVTENDCTGNPIVEASFAAFGDDDCFRVLAECLRT